jgi:hypothetical protein
MILYCIIWKNFLNKQTITANGLQNIKIAEN